MTNDDDDDDVGSGGGLVTEVGVGPGCLISEKVKEKKTL